MNSTEFNKGCENQAARYWLPSQCKQKRQINALSTILCKFVSSTKTNTAQCYATNETNGLSGSFEKTFLIPWGE